jgi:signal transduction histidine kinase
MPFPESYVGEHNIVKLNFFSLMVIIGLLSLSMGYLFISSYYDDFITEFENIKHDYIYLQKEKTVSQLHIELENIAMQNDQINRSLIENLKKKTYSAYKIARVIEATYHKKKSEQEIKSIVVSSVRSIRRESYTDCYLIDQYGHIYSLDQEQEKRPDVFFIDFPDKTGLSLMKRLSIKTRTQSEAYFRYGTKDDNQPNNEHLNGTMFLKHYESFNWFIGFGISDFMARKTTIDKVLSNLKNQGADHRADFEIYEVLGASQSALGILMDNRHPELVGSVLNINTKDAKGGFFLKELLEKRENPENQFIEIWEQKTKSEPAMLKYTHFKSYSKWNWLITKSFFPDSHEEINIRNKIEALERNIKDKLLYIAILFLFFVVIAILVSIVFSRKFGVIFNNYKSKVEIRTRELAEKNRQLKDKIHENALVENSLREGEYRLRQLASEVQLAEERERRQIAEDLHDSIGSTLSISNLKLEMLGSKLTDLTSKKDLESTHQLIKQVIQQTRFLTFQLSPPILYKMGLEAALYGLLEQTERLHHLKTEFEDDRQEKYLEEDIRIHLFRSVRELVVNSIKHAKADWLKVSVWKKNHKIHIEVLDDGQGFNVTQEAISSHEKAGFGLFSIRERLKLLGGQLIIESEIDKGTRVVIEAPLKGQ